MNKNIRANKGFTLLEILLVIAAIGILAAIVLVAINPNRQIAQVRNAERRSEVNTIYKALEQYLIEKQGYPAGITETEQDICINNNTTECVNLGVLVPDYVAGIPVDPSGISYKIGIVDGRVRVRASEAELGVDIAISGSGGTVLGGTGNNNFVEPNIGDAYGGGYFAGYISHTADGVATHRLIVAPAATGATGTGYATTTNLKWKTSQTSTAVTSSSFDGAANTAAMIATGANDHPAAKFCDDLSIGEFNDWYLPAQYELDIAYHNLKPTTANNNTAYGINPYSVPKRNANRTTTEPGRTSVTAFQSGQAEALAGDYSWASTQHPTLAARAWYLFAPSGVINADLQKDATFVTTRAFRREAI
jgi:prepilin-type N-terminal cleavage/methylation domain-containing protein